MLGYLDYWDPWDIWAIGIFGGYWDVWELLGDLGIFGISGVLGYWLRCALTGAGEKWEMVYGPQGKGISGDGRGAKSPRGQAVQSRAAVCPRIYGSLLGFPLEVSRPRLWIFGVVDQKMG